MVSVQSSVVESATQLVHSAQSVPGADAWSGFMHISVPVAIDAPIVGLTVRELFRLDRGSVLATTQPVESNLPIRAGGALIGWGEFQVVGETLAVRVSEMA